MGDMGTIVDVRIEGIADLQFNRFTGKAPEDVNLADQLYLDAGGGLTMPAANLLAFFYSGSYPSCLSMFWSNIKTRKIVGQSVKAMVFVDPQEIPILRKDKQIKFTGFEKNAHGKFVDEKADMWVDESLPRVLSSGKAVVPNLHLKRPVLRLPWAMEFQITVYEVEGTEITVDLVQEWLRRGGLMIGVGNHRPMFGRFRIAKFEVRK